MIDDKATSIVGYEVVVKNKDGEVRYLRPRSSGGSAWHRRQCRSRRFRGVVAACL